MKIRTDFVTNSSSSSYCVSLIVKTSADKEIGLDFWPENEDGSGEVMFPLKEDVDTVISRIKDCESVAQLRDFLVNAISLEEAFGEIDDCQCLETIAEAVENDEDGDFEDYSAALKEIQKTVSTFKNGMDKAENLGDIKSVSIREYFTGWGEFARDGVDDFLAKVFDDIDPEDAEAVSEALEGKLSEDAIADIVDHIESDSICQFRADITTTVTLADGNVEKEYSFDAD